LPMMALLERLPRQAGIRAGGSVRTGHIRAAVAVAAVDGAAVAVAVQFHAQPDQVIQDARVQVAGHDRGDRRVAGDPLGGLPVQPRALQPGPLAGGGAVRGPPGPQFGGPLLLQGRAAVEAEQVGQGDVRPYFDRLPAALGDHADGDQPLHGFLQGVVVTLLLAAVVFVAGRGGQGVQDLADGLGTLGG